VVAVEGDSIGAIARAFAVTIDEPPASVVDSRRAAVATIMQWIATGRGGEIPATDAATLRWLVERFPGRLQVGGTGAQAARTLGLLGFPALIHLTSLSPLQADVVAASDRLLVATAAGLRPLRDAIRHDDPTMFHVIFEYSAGCAVPLGDGSVVAPCDNRIIVSYDPINRAFPIDSAFVAAVGDPANGIDRALLSGFSQLADRATCVDRIAATLAAIASWRARGHAVWTHLEVGTTPDNWFLAETLNRLAPAVDSVGFNVEELALALDTRPEALDTIAECVAGLRALQLVLTTPRVGLHTRDYCLTVTRRDPVAERQALLFAGIVAGARARQAAFPAMEDLGRLLDEVPPSPAGLAAECQLAATLSMREGIAKLGDATWLVLAPTFAIARPAATVGLGDSFTAGLLALLPE
jgi:ADP-dependent phosphofructokinase/glucokinase